MSKIDSDFVRSLVSDFKGSYAKKTPSRVKILDAYSVFCLLIALTQVSYRVFVGTNFPENSYYSGVFAPIGSLVFTGIFFLDFLPFGSKDSLRFEFDSLLFMFFSSFSSIYKG